MTLTGPELLFALLAAHALCDFPLQGDFLARAKNHKDAIGKDLWKWALPAHGMIHGGAVLLLTGSLHLAITDAIIHGCIDWMKSDGRMSFNWDQMMHVSWRVLLCSAVVWGAA